MTDARRAVLAALISVLLVATAVTSLWLMASAGVFSGGDPRLANAPGAAAEPAAFVAEGGRAQAYQPRDPFQPLVTAAPTTAGTSTSEGEAGSTTSTAAGGGSSTTTGGSATTTSTTGGGSTTTTTAGDQPSTTRIALLEVREQQGVRTAVVTVDGVTYTVGVGDEFAEDLKVISLSATSGVFQIDTRVFTLAVGQSILK
jgi:hypothetical protein